MIYDETDINNMTERSRAALVNSLSGFKSANLVGTANKHGATNLAIMSSVVHLGSHPPLLALIVRPGGEERHTLANILELGCYTINHVNQNMIEAAHQTDRTLSILQWREMANPIGLERQTIFEQESVNSLLIEPLGDVLTFFIVGKFTISTTGADHDRGTVLLFDRIEGQRRLPHLDDPCHITGPHAFFRLRLRPPIGRILRPDRDHFGCAFINRCIFSVGYG